MDGVTEYCECEDVKIKGKAGNEIIEALNEGGHNCTQVDLRELLGWIKKNRPDIWNNI